MTANWPAWALLTLAAALGLIVALRHRRAALADHVERDSLPSDLKDAELLYLEKRFDVSEPVRLSTRLDRAYRMPSGLVVILELKTRSVNRAFPSDVSKRPAKSS
jgi:CRISPR-associated exonuclease Cas4